MLKSNGDLVRCVNSKTNQVIKIQRWICDDTFGSDKQRRDAQLWQSATGFKPQEVEPLTLTYTYDPTAVKIESDIEKENEIGISMAAQKMSDAITNDCIAILSESIVEQTQTEPVKKNIPQKRKRK